MKIQLLLIALLITAFGFGQEKPQTLKQKKTNGVKISSLTFSVNSKEDYTSINWNDIKEIFNHNTNKSEKIEMSFKYELPNSKNEMKGEIKVGGKLNNIDELISKAKKGLRGLIKIIDNNNK